jgi:hypothetical protein
MIFNKTKQNATYGYTAQTSRKTEAKKCYKPIFAISVFKQNRDPNGYFIK